MNYLQYPVYQTPANSHLNNPQAPRQQRIYNPQFNGWDTAEDMPSSNRQQVPVNQNNIAKNKRQNQQFNMNIINNFIPRPDQQGKQGNRTNQRQQSTKDNPTQANKNQQTPQGPLRAGQKQASNQNKPHPLSSPHQNQQIPVPNKQVSTAPQANGYPNYSTPTSTPKDEQMKPKSDPKRRYTSFEMDEMLSK